MTDMKLVIPKKKVAQGVWRGEVQKDAIDLEDKLFVLIPAFDRKHLFGPCRWQARSDTALPTKGDPCLVVFDDHKEPWIIAWWPKEFDT